MCVQLSSQPNHPGPSRLPGCQQDLTGVPGILQPTAGRRVARDGMKVWFRSDQALDQIGIAHFVVAHSPPTAHGRYGAKRR